MKLDDGRLTFVAQQEVTALDAIHKAVLGKAACAGRVTEGVGTCISIHAPTWGATWHVVASIGQCDISIHAPTWGATDPKRGVCVLGYISIHAPTWGATRCGASSTKCSLFQSTHPRGVRLQNSPENADALKFQSTHPRGVRHPCLSQVYCAAQISIHAPTWGATQRLPLFTIRISNFNPRTHVGCDRYRHSFADVWTYFNPRTHVGCDLKEEGEKDS